MKKLLTLEDISSYTIARAVSNKVYAMISSWKWLDKQTIGIQIIRSTDSIAANIAEGFGRYHKADKIKFYFNARGSALESAHWFSVAKERKLLNKQQYNELDTTFQALPKEINNLIRLTNLNLKR